MASGRLAVKRVGAGVSSSTTLNTAWRAGAETLMRAFAVAHTAQGVAEYEEIAGLWPSPGEPAACVCTSGSAAMRIASTISSSLQRRIGRITITRNPAVTAVFRDGGQNRRGF